MVQRLQLSQHQTNRHQDPWIDSDDAFRFFEAMGKRMDKKAIAAIRPPTNPPPGS
jgi:hypothetical protein